MTYSQLFTTLRSFVLLGLVAYGLASCEKEPVDTYYQLQSEPGLALLGANVTTITKYAPSETITIFMGYNQTDQVRDFTIFQVVANQDSMVVGTYPVNNPFVDPTSKLLIQPIEYVVPANLANKTAVRVDVTTNFTNGGSRMRRFTYNVAAAPTLKLAATAPITYRNGLAATAQSANDLVGYSLVINEGGIATVPTTPTTSTLFKAVDSLSYFYQIGTQTPVRIGSVRNPTTGAANTRTIDLRVPTAATTGQSVQFVFVAYSKPAPSSQPYAASVVTPAITVAAPTPLPTVRRGSVSFGPGSSPDSLAFNLKLGQNEPAANAATAKDLIATGSTATSVTLAAGNTTRVFQVPASLVPATYYTQSSANTVGNFVFQNTLVADLGSAAVGSVYAVKVRGTGEVMLLRITGVRLGTNSSIARVKFEYRSL
ncbi:hypothetical protein [Hymenobacter crusticola]|uniref:Uncharacterized protein n=1 Tax=Hymenobacter crusticola TaxID=1770526 RepID=A0A243W958_9BACT|nr:hypothetical protein [Hymenobacter crusticola]OUJ71940.1 hypothetical protein BXP70_20165 [Hymenobacter crusticola]